MSKLGQVFATIVLAPVVAFVSLIGAGHLLGTLNAPRPASESQVKASVEESVTEPMAENVTAPVVMNDTVKESSSTSEPIPASVSDTVSVSTESPAPAKDRPPIGETPSGGVYWSNDTVTEDAMLTVEYILRENFGENYTLDVIGSDFYIYVWDEAITEQIETNTYDVVNWNYLKNQAVYCCNSMTSMLQASNYWHNCTIELCNDETHSKPYLIIYNGEVDYDFRRGWE